MGPNPRNFSRNPGYVPWSTDIATFRCPSDPGKGAPALGRTNYAVCMGDSPTVFHNHYLRGNLTPNSNGAVLNFNSVSRGFFQNRKKVKFADVLDGLSNTIAMGEIITDLGDNDKRSTASWQRRGGHSSNNNPLLCFENNEIDPERPNFWCRSGGNCTPPANLSANNHEARGAGWANFRPMCTAMFTVLAPNRENCVGTWIDSPGTMPASSRHVGGAHVLMGDGAVKFISESIEAGNSRAGGIRRNAGNARTPGSPSPYGVWGALGTRGARESVDYEL